MTIRSASQRLVRLAACVLLLPAAAWAAPRTARVAGAFYPDDPAVLRTTVEALLAQHAGASVSPTTPRILISPHAGYPYSGPVAARAFREIQGRHYDGVVVIGFTHRQAFGGTSVDDRDSYQTPLGTIPIDVDAVQFLRAQPGISHVEEAHESGEHSMEVMLPFLQVAMGEFKAVPMLMGRPSLSDAEQLADALAKLAARGDYLFVFSTDLSHYHPYDEAVRLDQGTVSAMVGETPQAAARLFQADIIEACGQGPIMAALLLSDRMGYLERRLLWAANSGDTTGTMDRVVGYAALAMYPRAANASVEMVSPEAGQALVRAARQTIEAKLRPTAAPPPVSLEAFKELQQARGMFVTLRKQGQLRGCIGRIETQEPMRSLLPTVALESALEDARFPPMTAEELADVTVEVSVLSPSRSVPDASAIVPGRDGVVLRKGNRGGVFLPQVWEETGWTRVEFLRELASQKAGLDPDAWKDADLFTFQDQAFEERPTPH